MTIAPEPTDTPSDPTPPVGFELANLADFIEEHAASDFDRTLASLLMECAMFHDSWSQNCRVQHWHDDFPCDDYERSLYLGIAWLKSRVGDAA